MRTVPLGGNNARGRVALVSDAKYDLVMAYRWQVWEKRRLGSTYGPYANTTITHPDGRRSTLGMHQLVMGCAYVDHRDGDGLNNQDGNLRKATTAQNNCNQRLRADNTSGFKGVHLHRAPRCRHRKWQARIQVDGKRRSLGYFVDPVAAALAYDAAAADLHGEFASLNFPPGHGDLSWNLRRNSSWVRT